VAQSVINLLFKFQHHDTNVLEQKGHRFIPDIGGHLSFEVQTLNSVPPIQDVKQASILHAFPSVPWFVADHLSLFV
jgi:hypothetical protein